MHLPLPLHGRFGAEAMASGCALATCDRVDLEPFPPGRPIWHIAPDNLVPQLQRLLSNRALRVALGTAGIAHAERYHGHVAVARRILESLAPDTIADPYPPFFVRHFQKGHGDVLAPGLLRLTDDVVSRWGLPGDVDVTDLVARRLCSPALRGRTIPRWMG